ncbi:MAG: SH3 domain-containing protein [Alphaproteobacteria bacterium]|nr:SH3 domain-containing protein [Alphaproteobacteria bacterium]
MSRWLVSQGDRQFTVQDLEELKQLADKGELSSTDMIQPPGAADWLYASEIPELKGRLKSAGGGHDDYDDLPKSTNTTPILIALLLVILGGGYGAWHYYNQLPQEGELDLLGEGGLAMTEMLITQPDAPLYDKPDGSIKSTLDKDSEVAILGKRGDWYHVSNDVGAEGYVKADHVVPAYFFAGKETRDDYDPLYNPDRYISVKNASWLQLDQRNEALTIFQFLLKNDSKFIMTDVVLLATVKDASGKELEKVEIPIEGHIPRYEAVMVGTLAPEQRDGEKRLMTTAMFDELVKDDEELNLRWSDGVEVEMESTGFNEANIDILEVRAVPNDRK